MPVARSAGMLGRISLVVLAVALVPATVQAFDHHHDDEHGGGGCSSSSTSSSSSVATPTPTAVPTPLPSPGSTGHKRVFVTSITYAGALGSVRAADAACQRQADEQALGGVFQAWLSDKTVNAYDRVASDGPWYTTADALAFGSKADLRGTPRAELMDELGGYPQAGGAWSGSDASGLSTGADCDGWTNATSAATATTGSAVGFDPTWGGAHATTRCDAKASLICLQD
jgi:hypothetical protein